MLGGLSEGVPHCERVGFVGRVAVHVDVEDVGEAARHVRIALWVEPHQTQNEDGQVPLQRRRDAGRQLAAAVVEGDRNQQRVVQLRQQAVRLPLTVALVRLVEIEPSKTSLQSRMKPNQGRSQQGLKLGSSFFRLCSFSFV